MKKCIGCGIELQSDNILNIGYTTSLEHNLCMRCFKVINYGETSSVEKDNEYYINILKNISNTKSLVLYIVDILNIKENLSEIKNYLKNDIILVLNKRDVLPKSVKDEKIINYLKERYDFLDIIVVSSIKNYNLDLLMSKILKYKKENNVYFVGETNAGKSSLINKIISLYGNNETKLTVSNMPETTLEKIKIKINDNLNIIDTPGIVEKDNIINYLEKKYYKLLNTNREIKPKTFQIFRNQSLLIGEFLRIDYLEGDRNSFTLYIPNGIKVKKINSKHSYLKDLSYKEYELNFQNDLVIYGLGFIKITINGKIGIYLDKDVKTFLRKNII